MFIQYFFEVFTGYNLCFPSFSPWLNIVVVDNQEKLNKKLLESTVHFIYRLRMLIPLLYKYLSSSFERLPCFQFVLQKKTFKKSTGRKCLHISIVNFSIKLSLYFPNSNVLQAVFLPAQLPPRPATKGVTSPAENTEPQVFSMDSILV